MAKFCDTIKKQKYFISWSINYVIILIIFQIFDKKYIFKAFIQLKKYNNFINIDEIWAFLFDINFGENIIYNFNMTNKC